MLESLFVTHWVRDKPEEAVDRYLESIAFDHRLEATSGIKHDPGNADDFNYYLLGDDDLKKMASKYGPYNERAWTGLGGIHDHFKAIKHRIPESIQRATEIYLEVGHRDNNRMLHSSARGLSKVGRVVDKAGEEGVWLKSGPSTSHVGDALSQTWWIFSQMYLETAKQFEFPDFEGLARMVKVQQWSFLEKPEGVDPDRNDPCWCGSEEKFKRCHGK